MTDTEKAHLDGTRRDLESIINSDPVLRSLFTTRTPSYRYFHHKGSQDLYFWTTEPVKHKGRQRYASGIYCYLKTKNVFRLTQSSYHALRKDAKARALKLWEGAK